MSWSPSAGGDEDALLGTFEEVDATDVLIRFMPDSEGGAAVTGYTAHWSGGPVPEHVQTLSTPAGLRLLTEDWWGIFPSVIRHVDAQMIERTVDSWRHLPEEARDLSHFAPSTTTTTQRWLHVTTLISGGDSASATYRLDFVLNYDHGRDRLMAEVAQRSSGSGRSAARITGRCTGHGCFAPRDSISGSGDVFINGLGAHRLNDGWAVHCCGKKCHDGTLAEGSSTVFVNGKPLGHIGDRVDCGSACAMGSKNVFAGG